MDLTGSGSEFDPIRIMAKLNDHRVAFVVIGGVASRLLGSPSITVDLDICYERSRSNRERLASALRELHATLRGADLGRPFQLDAKTFELGDSFTFATDFGPFGCLGTPTGTNGFADLVKTARDLSLAGVPIKIASLDDLIRMKRAADRPKDRIELEILGALRDVIDGEQADR